MGRYEKHVHKGSTTLRSLTVESRGFTKSMASAEFNIFSFLACITVVVKGSSSLAPNLTLLDNGVITIGVDSNRGGSITYLSQSRSDFNVINSYDMGREVQLSFYSGPNSYEPTPGSVACDTVWYHGQWPWNPIGAGDVVGHGGTVLDIQVNSTSYSLYVRSRPLQWACDNVECECIFEKWIQLEGTAAVVKARLSNNRSDKTQYGGYFQELPAVYTIGYLYRLFTYNGTSPFTGSSVIELNTDGPIWTPGMFTATESWAAMLDSSGVWGLGVYQPDTIRFSAGFSGTRGSGGPSDPQTGYIAPNQDEMIDWNIQYDYTYHLILGNLDTIRAYVYQNPPPLPCLSYEFQTNRQHFTLNNAADSGVPGGYWHVIMEQNDPQLLGPVCLWDAEKYSVLHINASYSSTQVSSTAQVFWSVTATSGGQFSEAQSVRFPVIPDGQFRIYEVDLSTNPTYTGPMYCLRFDPVDMGVVGSYVNVASIFLTNQK